MGICLARGGKSRVSPTPASPDVVRVKSNAFITENHHKVMEVYHLDKTLGDGGFGQVKMVIHKPTNDVRAMKIIKKSIIRDSIEEERLFNEVEMLRSLDHPNILKLHEFMQDRHYYYLITEICRGGELFDRIVDKHRFTESEAADYLFQILSGLNYCHKNMIVHRDLKPENLLLLDNSDHTPLKIIDFGTSRTYDPKTPMTQRLGTPYYLAPEVLNGSYDEKCDLWSCGVILYIMLSGYPPFVGDSDQETLKLVSKGKFSMGGPVWKNVTSEARDLVRRLLTLNPAKRISAAEALQHKWIKSRASNEFVRASLSKEALESLRNFGNQSKLKHASLLFLTSQCHAETDKKALEECFRALDSDGDGKLSRKEISDGFRKLYGDSISDREVKMILDLIDADGNGALDYTEFILATLNRKQLLTDKKLKEAFQAFDLDGDGFISIPEIRQVLGGKQDYEERIWKAVIEEVDQNGDGKVSFDEFKDLMRKNV